MRYLLSVLLFVVAFVATGQRATIVYKTGEEKAVQIKSSTTTELNTDVGVIKFDELTSISIPYEDAGMAAKLQPFGVLLLVNGKEVKAKSPVFVSNEPPPAMGSLEDSIEKFRIQRTQGKALQLAGVLAIGASLIVATTADEPQLDLVTGLAIGGTVLSTAGFIIDLDAGNRLKRRR
jgi:hypothetical protein